MFLFFRMEVVLAVFFVFLFLLVQFLLFFGEPIIHRLVVLTNSPIVVLVPYISHCGQTRQPGWKFKVAASPQWIV